MSTVPACIGIILDGNRRWAKEQGLSSFEGHRRGVDNLETIVYAAHDAGVAHVIVYAFSTENWGRTPEEVSYLMQLFETAIREKLSRLATKDIAVRFVGELRRFPHTLQNTMEEVTHTNPGTPKTTLWMCLSYGGRAELAQAARATAASGESITEESLAKHLWTAGMPDPDLIIRTGGEKRLSGFLPWQSIYSELFFIEKYWPAFTKEDLETILEEYAVRERRMGK